MLTEQLFLSQASVGQELPQGLHTLCHPPLRGVDSNMQKRRDLCSPTGGASPLGGARLALRWPYAYFPYGLPLYSWPLLILSSCSLWVAYEFSGWLLPHRHVPPPLPLHAAGSISTGIEHLAFPPSLRDRRGPKVFSHLHLPLTGRLHPENGMPCSGISTPGSRVKQTYKLHRGEFGCPRHGSKSNPRCCHYTRGFRLPQTLHPKVLPLTQGEFRLPQTLHPRCALHQGEFWSP